jgi:hypothetical protein
MSEPASNKAMNPLADASRRPRVMAGVRQMRGMTVGRIACTLLLVLAVSAQAQERPNSLTCTANAKAWRDWSLTEKRWEGKAAEGQGRPFGISTLVGKDPDYPLRDKVFSNLLGSTPIVRSITPATRLAAAESVEFEAKVLLRTSDEVFLTWTNDANKVWLAVVDLKHRKAVVTQVFEGATSVGGEIETLDCR